MVMGINIVHSNSTKWVYNLLSILLVLGRLVFSELVRRSDILGSLVMLGESVVLAVLCSMVLSTYRAIQNLGKHLSNTRKLVY